MLPAFFITLLHRSVKTIVYTLGHIGIALTCAVVITGASVASATVDALIEPFINSGWFFLLDSVWPKGRTFSKTCLYTLGHIGIAVVCIVLITGSELSFAVIDAVIEPILNAFWYYALESFWSTRENTTSPSFEAST